MSTGFNRANRELHEIAGRRQASPRWRSNHQGPVFVHRASYSPSSLNLDPVSDVAATDMILKDVEMDMQTKHEIAVITSCMLAAIPIFGSLGFAVVAGLLIW
jgi:hypothetical protein